MARSALSLQAVALSASSACRSPLAEAFNAVGLLGHFLKHVSGSGKSASRRMSMWLIVLRRFLAGGDGP
ncbi:MAG: hypothetical protein JXB62_14695, partial [Pirellulales bacterium]|nr:hypothetical protein [Pirellulales bacterium]